VNKSLAGKAKVAASKAAASISRASKVASRTPDRAASKVAADSRSRASRVVSRTPDKAASMVVADSRSRASSLDSANFPLRESFPGFEPGFFYSDFLTQQYVTRKASFRFDLFHAFCSLSRFAQACKVSCQ
jgi:hypothetical protein